MATATVEICVIGDVLAEPDYFSIPSDGPSILDVLSNDTINGLAGGTPDVVPRLITPPQHGTVIWNEQANVYIYTPTDPTYCGGDEFEYELVALEHIDLCSGIQNTDASLLGDLMPGFTWGDPSFYLKAPALGTHKLEYDNGSDTYWASTIPSPAPSFFCEKGAISLTQPVDMPVLLSHDC